MLHCINVALAHIALLMLHFLLWYHLMLHLNNVALFYVVLLISDYSSVALFDVALFDAALFTVALF